MSAAKPAASGNAALPLRACAGTGCTIAMRAPAFGQHRVSDAGAPPVTMATRPLRLIAAPISCSSTASACTGDQRSGGAQRALTDAGSLKPWPVTRQTAVSSGLRFPFRCACSHPATRRRTRRLAIDSFLFQQHRWAAKISSSDSGESLPAQLRRLTEGAARIDIEWYGEAAHARRAEHRPDLLVAAFVARDHRGASLRLHGVHLAGRARSGNPRQPPNTGRLHPPERIRERCRAARRASSAAMLSTPCIPSGQ